MLEVTQPGWEPVRGQCCEPLCFVTQRGGLRPLYKGSSVLGKQQVGNISSGGVPEDVLKPQPHPTGGFPSPSECSEPTTPGTQGVWRKVGMQIRLGFPFLCTVPNTKMRPFQSLGPLNPHGKRESLPFPPLAGGMSDVVFLPQVQILIPSCQT